MCALLCGGFVIAESLFGKDLFAILGGLSIIAYLALEARRMDRGPVVLTLVAFGIYVFLILRDQLTYEFMVQACRRSAFLGFFILAVNSLKEAAQTSRTVRDCGQILIQQAPGRRYLWLSAGGGLIGVLANLGAVTLLATMVRKSIEEDPLETDNRVKAIRQRRMTLAAMRGFSTVPLWSPTSVTVALLLASVPGLRWIDILPGGLALAIGVILIGWALDRITYPKRNLTTPAEPERQSLMPFLHLAMVILALPLMASVLSPLLGISSITALLLSFPLVALGWIVVQNLERGFPAALRAAGARARNEMMPALALGRNEVSIFAGSGLIAVAILSFVDIPALTATLNRLDLAPDVLLISASVLMIIATIAGLNPIVSATVLIETLVQVEGLGIPHIYIVLTIAFTWCISVSVGPMTTTARMVGRILNEPAVTVSLAWNWSFGLVCLAILYFGLLCLL